MNVIELREQHPKLFQQAYEKWSCQLFGEWWEPVYEQAIEDGERIGFEIGAINFSGFSSQGDGASWRGLIRVEPYVKAHCDLTEPKYSILLALLEEGYVAGTLDITNAKGHYCHEGSMSTTGGLWFYDGNESVMKSGVYQGANVQQLQQDMGGFDFLDELDDELLEGARSYARDIYKQLEEEYDYLTSIEYYVEYCMANDVAFDVVDNELSIVYLD